MQSENAACEATFAFGHSATACCHAGGIRIHGFFRTTRSMDSDQAVRTISKRIDEVMARKTLQPSDYFTRNWALTPDALQQAAAAASVHERPFDAIRPLNHFP